MKIGILTSGGDCPGLNAVIRGAVLKGIAIHGHEFVGFLDGWRGVVEGDIIDIPRTMVRGIAKQGGTILGTSRTNPFENGGGPEVIKAHGWALLPKMFNETAGRKEIERLTGQRKLPFVEFEDGTFLHDSSEITARAKAGTLVPTPAA